MVGAKRPIDCLPSKGLTAVILAAVFVSYLYFF